MTLIRELPHPIPKAEWVPFDPTCPEAEKLQEAFNGAWHGTYWQPKTVKMSDGRTAVDLCADTHGALGSVKMAMVEDHKFLDSLPHNAPRVIRHLYRSATRMRYLRAWDAWGFFSDMAKAEAARETYNAAIEAPASRGTADRRR